MEKFWAAILIFVVVAAAGLMYVNQVYNPQKDSQAAMAETANQTLSAVKSEMDNDTTLKVVYADEVIQIVKDTCDSTSNTVTITVIVGGTTKVFTDDYNGIDAHVGSTTKPFLKTPVYENGKLKSIEFKEI